MAIKNKLLKNYIHSNTTLVIRSRGNQLLVLNLVFSENSNSVKAYVKGTKKYEINFDGFQSGLINSTCTCPFDQGNVCKHEVAVANEIDLILDERKNSNSITLKEKVKISVAGYYKIPFLNIADISATNLRKHTTKYAYKEASTWGFKIEDISINKNRVQAVVYDDYYDQSPKTTTLTILENELSLLCTCKNTNGWLCKHQVKLLETLREEFSTVFLSEEKVKKLKIEELKKFGFSIEDPKVEEYFEFGFSGTRLEVIPKKKGIVPLLNYSNLSSITGELLNEELIIKSVLPAKIRQVKKKETIAIGVLLNNNLNNPFSLSLVPLKGNSNTENELVSKIEEVELNNYFSEKNQYSKEEQFIIENAFPLIEESFKPFYKEDSEGSEGRGNKIINGLTNLIPKIGKYKTYLIKGGCNRLTKKNLELIKIHLESPKISFKLIEEEDFYLLECYISYNGKKAKLSKRNTGENTLLLKDKNDYFLIKSVNDVKTIYMFRNNPEIRFPKIDYDNYYTKLIQPLSEKYTIEIKGAKTKNKKADISLFKKQLFLSSVDDFIIFKPAIGYQDKIVELFSKKQLKFGENGSSYIIPRNESIEDSFKDYLKKLHPNFNNQNNDFFYLSEDDFIKNTWFINAFDSFKENEVEVFGYNDLKLKYNQHKPTISISVSSNMDWFDVRILVAFGEQTVSLRELKKNIINKDKYIRLKDGSIGILPEEWLDKYLHLFRSGEVKKDSIGVSKYQFSVVDTLYEELQNESNLFEEHLKIKEKIANFDTIENIAKPRGLNAKLRPYQKEGIKWLNFLDDFKLGGCLADDMGLGKTLQIIGFIQHLKFKNKSKIPHLIIVPTSLVFNWNDEVQKFCPSLKIFTLTGGKRNKDITEFEKYDIILTTYGIVLNDIDYLKNYKFNYIILDESQAIKNPNSKRFKAVCLLKAQNRLVLTGTPIQNNTFDLYAQMTFVNPGLLGSISNFKKEYATAIDKNKDIYVAKELKALIDPFLLRRTKEQVATELPSKTEQFLYCTMGAEQRKLYEAYKNKYKDYLLGKIETDGIGKSKMYVLEGLTKLRQICDSPSLLNDDEEYTNESVKIDELIKHITEKTNNHKILIFSQFVKMLGLIKSRLEELGIVYEYLDGQTKNRQERVNNFQNNEDTRVFLISLKAGGTGLNLTAADYVYIVDPWWNPAVEAQAIDRCYRIGQTKKVMAYKMICKDTIEEKIVIHQQNKKQVSDDLIQIEESFVKSLNKESIQELFS